MNLLLMGFVVAQDEAHVQIVGRFFSPTALLPCPTRVGLLRARCSSPGFESHTWTLRLMMVVQTRRASASLPLFLASDISLFGHLLFVIIYSDYISSCLLSLSLPLNYFIQSSPSWYLLIVILLTVSTFAWSFLAVSYLGFVHISTLPHRLTGSSYFGYGLVGRRCNDHNIFVSASRTLYSSKLIKYLLMFYTPQSTTFSFAASTKTFSEITSS
jgi:hypothetical protein